MIRKKRKVDQNREMVRKQRRKLIHKKSYYTTVFIIAPRSLKLVSNQTKFKQVNNGIINTGKSNHLSYKSSGTNTYRMPKRIYARENTNDKRHANVEYMIQPNIQ